MVIAVALALGHATQHAYAMVHLPQGDATGQAGVHVGICVLEVAVVVAKVRVLMDVKGHVTRRVLRLERVLTPVVMHVVTAPLDVRRIVLGLDLEVVLHATVHAPQVVMRVAKMGASVHALEVVEAHVQTGVTLIVPETVMVPKLVVPLIILVEL